LKRFQTSSWPGSKTSSSKPARRESTLDVESIYSTPANYFFIRLRNWSIGTPVVPRKPPGKGDAVSQGKYHLFLHQRYLPENRTTVQTMVLLLWCCTSRQTGTLLFCCQAKFPLRVGIRPMYDGEHTGAKATRFVALGLPTEGRAEFIRRATHRNHSPV
jgi:hypothetical protein